jgi:hypothetical protein
MLSTMNSEIQEVINTCISLDEAGKKPSLGMLKARLLTPLPIPIIIKGLSYWKENKASLQIEALPEPKAASKNTNDDLLIRVSDLEKEVRALRTELKMLKRHFSGEES